MQSVLVFKTELLTLCIISQEILGNKCYNGNILKVKPKKNVIIFGIIVLVGFLVILSPLRYKITGTNKGYIYKTDRLTGKTYIVGPSGEIEIDKYQKPSPTPQPQQFPLYKLQILSTKSRTSGSHEYADITIKNRDTKTAYNIQYKITYSKTKNGDIFDTEYENNFEKISGGDTVTDSVLLKSFDDQFWYSVSINSANYK